VKRGEIWSVAARGAYTGKPRPAVIVQDNHFDATASVTICVLTTDPTEAPLFRLPVQPDARNGLDRPSSLMVDKLATVPRTSLGEPIGRLGDEDVVRLDRAIVVFLGLG
jgi:mRNA interferase MazF